MGLNVRAPHAGRLERSCSPRPDSVRFGTGAVGLERAEVYLSTYAFAPHRHDTYAIGLTTSGVQTFRYRRARHVCLPGQLHILHPDETHDGAAATSPGFGYRILYVAPELVHEALGGRALPFVGDVVQDLTPATQRMSWLLNLAIGCCWECRLRSPDSESPPLQPSHAVVEANAKSEEGR